MTDTDVRKSATTELESALTKVSLTELQRDLLKVQWLGMLAWMDRRAARSWTTYAVLRLITIVGAVFVPAFVAINPSAEWAPTVRIVTFALSLCVALAAALESFFRSGDRWRHYRRNAEALRLEGMQFLMLSGPYTKAASHEDAFHDFATRLNGILGTEVDTYFTQVAVEKSSSEKAAGRDAPAR